VFLLFPSQIFSFFLNQPDLIDMGSNYLRIIGLSQIFMCIEIVTMASFNGLGKTHIPAMVSVIFTMMRIPLVLFLAKYSTLGLNSIWVAISLTSILKGVLLVILFQVYLKKENIMHLNGKVKNAQA